MKRWIRVAGVTMVGLGIGLLILEHYLGRLVQVAIETMGPHITGTPVTVEKVDLSPRLGTGTLRGLVIGNPPPYKDPYALRLGEVHVEVDLASLRSNTVVVRSVIVTDAEVSFEGVPHHSNLRTLLDTVNGRVGQDSKKPSTPEDSFSERRVRLDEFVVHRMRVRARLNVVGITTPAAGLTLPEVRLTGLGSNGAGLTIAEVGRDVLQAVYAQVISSVGPTFWILNETQNGTHWLRDKTSGAIRDASKAVGDLFRKKESTR